jgi:hypothetical protein
MDNKTQQEKSAGSTDKSPIDGQSKVSDADVKLTTAHISAKATIISALIGAIGALLVAMISLYAVDDREKKIMELTADIAQRDAQIQSLTEEVNSLKHPLQEILAQDGKVPFEWQWAGENWYGRVVMEKQAEQDVITQAQIGLLEKNLIDDMIMHGQVLNLVPGTGSLSFTEDGVIHLEFVVRKKDRRLGTESTAFVTGDLQQSLCYAGQVNYKETDTGNQYPGNIILVNYITPLGDSIDYWFSPNKDQPWFERYLIDR